MSVRISANDWLGEEGITPEDAVDIAKAFAQAETLIDVSAGQTSIDAKPVMGGCFKRSSAIVSEAGGDQTIMLAIFMRQIMPIPFSWQDARP